MKKTLSFFLAATLSHSQMAQAQTLDVTSQLLKLTPVSVTYSRIHNKVLLGTMDDRNVVSFSECDVPQLAKDQTASLAIIENCVEVPDSKFLAGISVVERINSVFPEELKKSFNAQQENENRERADEVKGARAGISIMAFFVSAVVGTASGASFIKSYSSFQRGHFFRGAGAGILGVLAAALSVGAYIVSTNDPDPRDYPIKSLEEAVIEKSKEVLSGQADTSFKPSESEIKALYPATKNAIINSIRRALTL